MKNVIVFAFAMMTAISSAFAGEKMEIVTVSTGEVVNFQISITYTADSCNSVSIGEELLATVSKSYRGGKLYEPSISLVSTVVGCLNNKTTQETIVSNKVYTTKENTTVRLLLPENYSVIIIE